MLKTVSQIIHKYAKKSMIDKDIAKQILQTKNINPNQTIARKTHKTLIDLMVMAHVEVMPKVIEELNYSDSHQKSIDSYITKSVKTIMENYPDYIPTHRSCKMIIQDYIDCLLKQYIKEQESKSCQN